MLKFLICGGGGYKQTIFVACANNNSDVQVQSNTNGKAANNTDAGDSGMNNRNMIREFRLEHTVEILRTADSHKAI